MVTRRLWTIRPFSYQTFCPLFMSPLGYRTKSPVTECPTVLGIWFWGFWYSNPHSYPLYRFQLKKYFLAANREKESMVVKYAMGERDIIIQRKAREDAEKKLHVNTFHKLKLQNFNRGRIGNNICTILKKPQGSDVKKLHNLKSKQVFVFFTLMPQLSKTPC